MGYTVAHVRSNGDNYFRHEAADSGDPEISQAGKLDFMLKILDHPLCSGIRFDALLD
jgi:hypothetical protein